MFAALGKTCVSLPDLGAVTRDCIRRHDKTIMFTGIVTAVGTVSAVVPAGDERRITIDAGCLDTDDVAVGDSIAVDGVCLTVVDHRRGCLSFDVSGETLACTTLGERVIGDEVNLEAAMLPTTRLGGHLVSGHVDGVGRVSARRREGNCERFTIEVPTGLEQYIARKGSLVRQWREPDGQ